jgi:hypothetical protein
MPAKKPQALCLECGAPATFQHHVVPRSLGGTATVPLCGTCHPLAHNQSANWKVSELTREALRRKKARGEILGGAPPYGFEIVDKNKLKPVPFEMEAVAVMRSLRCLGLSLRAIAALLYEHRIPTKGGKATWGPKTISRILLRTEGKDDKQ